MNDYITVSDLVAPVVLKAAYIASNLTDVTWKEPSVETRARLEGVALIASDVLGLSGTPFGFRMAVCEAVAAVGPLGVPAGATRERAAEIRSAWNDAVVAATLSRLGMSA